MQMNTGTGLLDDMGRDGLGSALGPAWRAVSDRVMGGVSTGTLRKETVAGRPAIRLTGTVSLANNGGFLQASLDLAKDGGLLDVRGWTGLDLDVLGDGGHYKLLLKTADLPRPWQSYRQDFTAAGDWRTVRLPFAGFTAHRTDAPLDLARLRRLGLVAIGEEREVDVALAGLRLYA
jgi:hypothetical protein